MTVGSSRFFLGVAILCVLSLYIVVRKLPPLCTYLPRCKSGIFLCSKINGVLRIPDFCAIASYYVAHRTQAFARPSGPRQHPVPKPGECCGPDGGLPDRHTPVSG